MKYYQVPVGPIENLSYLLWDENTNNAAIIDPAWDTKLIEQKLKENNLYLELILLTHAHPDHINKCEYFLQKYSSIKVIMHKEDTFLLSMEFGGNVSYTKDSEKIKLGQGEILVIHTPGHTPGSVCYMWGKTLFTGDTLFAGCCGRVDLPGSNPESMRQSLIKIFKLPDDTEICPGHSYNALKTTIKAQKIANICYKYLNNKEEFYNVIT